MTDEKMEMELLIIANKTILDLKEEIRRLNVRIDDFEKNWFHKDSTYAELKKELQFYKKFVDEIDKAFERNKNFMWGNGKWSVISKARKALRELREEEAK